MKQQNELIKLCQNEAIWSKMLSLPHPYGMKHPFNNRPLSLADFAWASTMFESVAAKGLPIVKEMLGFSK